MKKNIVFTALFISFIGFSQTKVIAHKSHSGKNNNFKKALQSKVFDYSNSNFGELPNQSLSDIEKEKLPIQVRHKNIEYTKAKFSFAKPILKTDPKITMTLTSLPDHDFEIYVNEELIITKKNHIINKPIKVKLKKGVRNYVVLHHPKATENSPTLFIDVTINDTKYTLWTNAHNSNIIFIDQVAK